MFDLQLQHQCGSACSYLCRSVPEETLLSVAEIYSNQETTNTITFPFPGSSSSSAFPTVSLGFTFFFVPSCISSSFPAVSLGFTFFFFCVPSYISGVHLLLHSQLYVWGSPSSSAFPAICLGFTFFCVPSHISEVHLLFLLRSKLYLWGSLFWVRVLCM